MQETQVRGVGRGEAKDVPANRDPPARGMWGDGRLGQMLQRQPPGLAAADGNG